VDLIFSLAMALTEVSNMFFLKLKGKDFYDMEVPPGGTTNIHLDSRYSWRLQLFCTEFYCLWRGSVPIIFFIDN
jgi:hypothetical protein